MLKQSRLHEFLKFHLSLLPSPMKQFTKCKTSFKVRIFSIKGKVWHRKGDDLHLEIGRNEGLPGTHGPAVDLKYCRVPV